MIMTLEPSQPSLPTKKQLKLIYLLLKTTLYSADSWQVTLGKIHVWTWLKNFFFYLKLAEATSVTHTKTAEYWRWCWVSLRDLHLHLPLSVHLAASLSCWLQTLWNNWVRRCREKKVITTTAAKLRNFAVLLWWSLGNLEEGSSSENCCDHCRHTAITAAILGWEIASLSISRYCAVFSKNLLQWLEHRSLSGLMSQHLFLGTGIK